MTYNDEMKNVIKTEIKYRTSFVNEADFEGKRFDKYVRKVKEYIFDNYVKIAYPFVLERRELSIFNLNDFVIYFFQALFLSADDNLDAVSDKPSLMLSLHTYRFTNHDYVISKEILEKYLLSPYIDAHHSFCNVVEYEIREVCKEFIKRRTLELDNITMSNYFLTLPDSTKDAIFLVDSILNYVKIDIDVFCKSNFYNECANSIVNTLSDDTFKLVMTDNKELSNKVDDLNNILVTKDMIIKQLKDQLSSKNKNDENAMGIVIERNRMLERQLTKLKDKYDDLLQKYQSIKTQFDETDIESDVVNMESDVVSSLTELDLNKRYLFVSYDSLSFQNHILSVFKNALFCSSANNVNLSNIDMVIVITSYINHPTYYKFKDLCKNKNVPFLHCKYSNVELIKELISNFSN